MKKQKLFLVIFAVLFSSIFTTSCELMFFGLGDTLIYGKVIAEFKSENPEMEIVFHKKGKYKINGKTNLGDEFTEEGGYSGNPKKDGSVTLTPTDRLGKMIDEKNQKDVPVEIKDDKFIYQIIYKTPVDVIFVRQ